MDSFNQYKALFDAKVKQIDLGILAGLNLQFKKVGVDKAGTVFVDRYMLISNDSLNKWIPVFVVNADNQKLFQYTLSYQGKKYTVFLASPEDLVGDVIDLVSSKFENATISFDTEIPREMLRECQESFNWQVTDKAISALKGIQLKGSEFKQIRPLSSLSKAEVAAKVLKKDILFCFQQKFKNKK